MLWMGIGHCFDADPDPDPTYHFNADPDPDQDPEQDPSLSFTHVGKSVQTFIHSSASLYCFIFLVSVIGVIIFNILDNTVY